MAPRSTAWAAAAVIFLSAPGAADAQATLDFEASTNWLAGYVVNAPQQLLGFGTVAVFERLRGFGFYVDTKFDIDSPSRNRAFISGRTSGDAEEDGHIFFRDDSSWFTVNFALVKGLSEELALYAGVGYARTDGYSEWLDEEQEIGELGRYWVKDPGRDETHVNFIGGALFRLSNRIVFQFGAEAAPAGFTAGLHVRLR